MRLLHDMLHDSARRFPGRIDVCDPVRNSSIAYDSPAAQSRKMAQALDGLGISPVGSGSTPQPQSATPRCLTKNCNIELSESLNRRLSSGRTPGRKHTTSKPNSL